MSALLQGAKRLLGRKSELGEQIAGLELAVSSARGRLDDAQLDPAAAVVERAEARLRLSPEHTVVGLAGATGSGKSSTFNALTGLDLAAIGVRRPTTSWVSACIWGRPDGAEELLEWMGIPQRHQTSRDSMLDTAKEARDLKGLVLLDLPDHDSTEVSHHLEMERLIVLADLMIWVLDPQKYADAAIHERFLKPLAAHRDVMLVVLNHIDEVPLDKRAGMVEDVKRLLALDGLEGVPVFATSAKLGDGIAELGKEMARRVKDKKNTRNRFRIDVREAAQRLEESCGSAPPRDLSPATRNELNDAVADAAGVPVVVDAVARSSTLRATRATGWPPLKWVARLRPDPLKRLHLDLGSAGKHAMRAARTSVPQATNVQQARVETAVRRVADEVSGGLTRPWVAAIRQASSSQGADLADTVDRAVQQTPLGVAKLPLWCRVVQGVQWIAIAALLVGLGWLATLAALGFARVTTPDPPAYSGVPLPTLLLIAGAVVGIVLAAVSRVMIGLVSRSRARAADKRLRRSIDEVTEKLVVHPIDVELEAYTKTREGLTRAIG